MDNSILKAKLFEGLSGEQIDQLLNDIKPTRVEVKKGGTLYSAGEKLADIVLVLSGRLAVVSYDYVGNMTLHSQVNGGDIFGAAYCAVGELPFSVQAEKDTTVLKLPYKSLISPSGNRGAATDRVIGNLIDILSLKNVAQLEKMGHITKRTTREKIMSYLSAQAAKSGSKTVCVPFNREMMANYLAVDRAALSRELSKLKADGIIDYKKNCFTIYTNSISKSL